VASDGTRQKSRQREKNFRERKKIISDAKPTAKERWPQRGVDSSENLRKKNLRSPNTIRTWTKFLAVFAAMTGSR
jgi:hypothetical protein